EEPGSGVVEAGEPPRLGVAAEVRREAVLVEDDLGELDGGGGAGADQQIEAEAAGRGGDQPEVARAALDDLADESARSGEERSAADAHLHPAPHEAGDVGELDPLVPHAVIVSGAGAGAPKMWDAWWWIMRHRSPSRSNKFVASTAVTAIRSSCSVRMCSVHVTHARSPWLEGRTSASVKRISPVCVKMVSQEARTIAQPTRSGQPGCTHRTCSPWAQRLTYAWYIPAWLTRKPLTSRGPHWIRKVALWPGATADAGHRHSRGASMDAWYHQSDARDRRPRPRQDVPYRLAPTPRDAR